MAIAEDFEDAVLNFDFRASTAPGAPATSWFRSQARVHSGLWAFRSPLGVPDNGAASAVAAITVPSDAVMRMWLSTDSENNYDKLHVFLDGVERWLPSTFGGSGPLRPWEELLLGLTAGTHTVEFRYTKDSSSAVGMDAAFIDDLGVHVWGEAGGGGGGAAVPPRYSVGGGGRVKRRGRRG